MTSIVLRLLLATMLFFGTLAPSIAAADIGNDCERERTGLAKGHEHDPCSDEPPGDCQNCSTDCLCFCCALRCGAALSVVFTPAVMNAVGIVSPSPSQLSSLLSAVDIFHPPRV